MATNTTLYAMNKTDILVKCSIQHERIVCCIYDITIYSCNKSVMQNKGHECTSEFSETFSDNLMLYNIGLFMPHLIKIRIKKLRNGSVLTS